MDHLPGQPHPSVQHWAGDIPRSGTMGHEMIQGLVGICDNIAFPYRGRQLKGPVDYNGDPAGNILGSCFIAFIQAL